MLVRAGLVAGVLMIGGGLAWAEDAPPAGSLSVAQVTSRLETDGYKISKIKFDDGSYKVKALDSNGQKTKLSVNPQTGAVIAKGADDDND